MTDATDAYEAADKAVFHWRLILAGNLSPAQKRHARIELIRAVGQRVRTRMALEREGVMQREVVAA